MLTVEQREQVIDRILSSHMLAGATVGRDFINNSEELLQTPAVRKLLTSLLFRLRASLGGDQPFVPQVCFLTAFALGVEAGKALIVEETLEGDSGSKAK